MGAAEGAPSILVLGAAPNPSTPLVSWGTCHKQHPPSGTPSPACPQCLGAVGTMVAYVAPPSPPTASPHPNLFGSGLVLGVPQRG